MECPTIILRILMVISNSEQQKNEMQECDLLPTFPELYLPTNTEWIEILEKNE